MTLNDCELNAYCLRIRGVAERLNLAMRDGRVSELTEALELLHAVSKDALFRLNDIRFTNAGK